MFNAFALFGSRSKSGVSRRTAHVLDSLSAEVQKDIGWKWSPRLRGNVRQTAKLDFNLL